MAVENDAPEPVYRSAKQIPFELVQHSGIFFEENLCLFAPSSQNTPPQPRLIKSTQIPKPSTSS